MRSSRPLTVALAGLSWVALSYGALFAAFWLLDPLLEGLPRVLQALWLAATLALMAYAPPAFPLWRARLTVDDRRRLFFGSGAGAILGFFCGGIAALVVLEPDFTSIFQSTRSTAVLWSWIVGAGLAGAYLTARKLSLFAPTAAPRLDEPIADETA
jgi:hypothetical protein